MAKNTRNVTFEARTEGYGEHLDLIELLSTLAALGLDVTVFGAANYPELRELRCKVKVSVNFPGSVEAGFSHNRYAGRRTKYTSCNPELEIKTDREFLEWYDDGHTAEEGARALGLSRSTFYRRLAEYRKRVAERDERNRYLISKGKETLQDEGLDVYTNWNIGEIKFQK